MSKLREEALALAEQVAVIRAKVDVEMINAAPDEMLPMIINKHKEAIKSSEAMLSITEIMAEMMSNPQGE